MNDSLSELVIKIPHSKLVPEIFTLISDYAQSGLLLPLTKKQISERINSFYTAFLDDNLVACVALRNFGNKLFEVRSLAVHKNYSNRGIGSKIVAHLINDIVSKVDDPEIFALTYQVSFFQKLGFYIVNKDIFPQKIWSDCSNCPKFSHCDETAVLFNNKSSLKKYL